MAKRRTKARHVNPANLYPAVHLLSRQDRKELGLTVPATIYVQDPLVAAQNPSLGLEQIELDWEPGLMAGPTSARVAVVDHNADTGVLAEAAQWDPETGCFAGADDPHSFQFHQLNVWAIVQNTLAFFEDSHVLGRAIPWAFEGNRLVVVPHAGHRQNAFYDRRARALRFYYCGPAQNPVFTCLSHDIIAHETGHAILDGIRPYYSEISSPQTAAFHEFLADLTAILSAMRNNTVRGVVAEVSQGDLSKEATIGDLAEQFGQNTVERAHGGASRFYLRTAHNRLTMKDIEGEWRPHHCSQVLTGAVFDILTRMALLHLEQGASPRQALWHATDRMTRIALRPLDYCPPVDVQFVDYARAVLRADELAYPRDELGYRDIMRQSFAERGLSDLEIETPPYVVQFRRYDIARLSGSRTAAYHFLNENRALLRIPPEQDIVVADLYDTDKEALAGYRLPREIVVEYVWREDLPLRGAQFGRLEGRRVPLLCGGTLVFDGRGNVFSFTRKPGTKHEEDREEGEQRRERLLAHVARLAEAGVIGLMDEHAPEELAAQAPVMARQGTDGVLRLEIAPHLRHQNGE